jgi:hypothetical protein
VLLLGTLVWGMQQKHKQQQQQTLLAVVMLVAVVPLAGSSDIFGWC